MQDLIHRLYRTKLILASLFLVGAGIGLIVLGRQVDGDNLGWRHLIPWSELGGILFGAGLLSVGLDYLFQREQVAMQEAQLRTLLDEHAPSMADAVFRAFAADETDLARIAAPETLDRIAVNCLGLRLKDKQFASEVYAEVKQQTVDVAERWEGASLFINVSPLAGHDGYFDVTSRWEYRVVPKHLQRRFVSGSDRREHAELAHSHGDVSSWYRKPDDQFTAGDRTAFELLQFSVDGEDHEIGRSSRKAFQEYSVLIGQGAIDAGEPVTISYTTRTATKASGHMLFFDIEQPTNGINIAFDYTGTDIASVGVADLVQSMRPSRIEHTPEAIAPKTLRVEIDGWVFPRSGIAFSWTLQSELD